MQETIEYNPDVLQRLVSRLRWRAVFVMVLWPVIGVFAGAYLGLENGASLGAVVGAVVGAFIGYLIGSMRALYYRVQATNILCLKRIEENTRTRDRVG